MYSSGGIISMKKENTYERKDSYVLFYISKLALAIPFDGVKEIISYIQPVKIPGTPSYIEGVINYSGQICPVISISSLTGFTENAISAKTCIIMLESPENNSIVIGILADYFSGSVKIAPEEIMLYNGSITGLSNSCIAGEAQINNIPAIILYPFVFLKGLDFISIK